MARPDEDLTGQKVGEYEILTRIGAGGMGVVYEGVQPVIGKRVAVKVLLPQLSSDTELVERFLSEARAVNAIRHRGIIDIFSFGQLPSGQHYFVMEFLDGDGFDRLIKVKAPLPMFDVLSWTEEVLDALDAVHTSGIIHRDIKPSNLFLVNPGRGRSYVKLLDFGIAKLGALKGEATPQTRASVIIGTPDYMSPEQARGRNISPATDLYALACVMFELFSGKRVFKGENPMQTMFMHVENQPPRLSQYVQDVPVELDDLLLWTLEKDPANRPATAAEMKQHVEALKTLVPNDTTQAFSPLPRAYGAGGGPATPGPGSTRSRPMLTPPPKSKRVSKPVVVEPPTSDQDAAEDTPVPAQTRIVAGPTREEPKLERGQVSTDPAAAAQPEPEEPVALAQPPRKLSVVWVIAAFVALGALGTMGYLATQPAKTQQQPPLIVPPPSPPVGERDGVRGQLSEEEKKAEEAKKEAEKKAEEEAQAKKNAEEEAAAKKAADKQAAEEAAAKKKAAAEEAAAKKAADKQAAEEAAAKKKAAAEEAAAKKAADKQAADEKKKAAAEEAAAKKKAAEEAAAKKKPAGKVYTAEDLATRLAGLEKKLAAKEAKTGAKDRVLHQFLDQGSQQAAAAKTDEDRREVWKFLTEIDKQLGP